MTTKAITHNIDWLQYSVCWPDSVIDWPYEETEARAVLRSAVPYVHAGNEAIERAPSDKILGMQGYTRTYDFLYATAHVDPRRREQKIGVRMTGSELGMFRDMGGNDAKLADFIAGTQARTSRVDIAFDLFGYGIDPMRLYRDWKSGKLNGRFRKAVPMTEGVKMPDTSVAEASTVYFGSRQSELMVRVYEKGKEQHTELDWQRFEIEVKGDKAVAVMSDIHRLGAGTVGKQLLRDFFSDMPYKFWGDLTVGKSTELTSVGRKLTERQAWLRNIIFPLLREEIANEWDSLTETGITREIEALIREHWTTRAIAIRKQYGQI